MHSSQPCLVASDTGNFIRQLTRLERITSDYEHASGCTDLLDAANYMLENDHDAYCAVTDALQRGAYAEAAQKLGDGFVQAAKAMLPAGNPISAKELRIAIARAKARGAA